MKRTALILLAALTATACTDVAKNTSQPAGTAVTGSNGMKYVITCVEGHRFIATQSTTGYWSRSFWMLAGPIGECE